MQIIGLQCRFCNRPKENLDGECECKPEKKLWDKTLRKVAKKIRKT